MSSPEWMLGLSCCSLTFQRKREKREENCAKMNSLVRFLRRGEEKRGRELRSIFLTLMLTFLHGLSRVGVGIYSIATRHSSQPSFSLSFLCEFLISIKILLSVTTQLCAASAKKNKWEEFLWFVQLSHAEKTCRQRTSSAPTWSSKILAF